MVGTRIEKTLWESCKDKHEFTSLNWYERSITSAYSIFGAVSFFIKIQNAYKYIDLAEKEP